jgi:O-antigen/teichoic acid export membrane protein
MTCIIGIAILVVWRSAADFSWLLILSLVFFSLCLEKNVDTSLGVAIADGRVGVSTASLLTRRLTAVSVFGALAYGLEVGTAVAYGFALAAGSVVGLAHARIYVTSMILPGPQASSKDVIRRAIPFFLSNVSAQFRLADTLIVSQAMSVLAAGLYSAGQRITNPLMIIPSAVSSLILPHASRLGRAEARRLTRRLVGAAIVFLLFLVPLVLAADSVILVVFGYQYLEGSGALRASLLALPFIALSSPLGSLAQGQNFEKFVAWNGVLFALGTLAATFLGVTLAGITGAAAGVAVSYFCKCLALWGRLEMATRTPGLFISASL